MAATTSKRRKRSGRAKSKVQTNNTWMQMEEILENLKILDYEQKFCKPHSIKPFPRTMFAMKSSNKSTQFAQFMKLTTWLFVESGRENFKIDRFDDPTTSVHKVMLELKNMDFEMPYSHSQLLDGNGEAVCEVLQFLSKKALEESGFDWKKQYKPKYPNEEFAEEAEVDEEADVGAIVDDIATDSDDDDEDDEVMYTDMVHGNVNDDDDHAASTALIEAEVDVVKWKKELERVRPKLKVKLVTHDKEWRSHLDQAKFHEKAIGEYRPGSMRQLDAIKSDIGEKLERVLQKERYINQTFDKMRTEYREITHKLQSVNQQYSTGNDKLQELTNALALITDKLEDVQSRQEEKGSSMTNTGPLVRMKKAIQKLREDRNQMELRIGVVAHTLMMSEMRQKNLDDNDDSNDDSDGPIGSDSD